MIVGLAVLLASIPLSLLSMTTYYREYQAEAVYNVTKYPALLPYILQIGEASSLSQVNLSITNMDEHPAKIIVSSQLVEYSRTLNPGETVNFALDNVYYSVMTDEGSMKALIRVDCLKEEKPFLPLSIVSLITFITGTILVSFYVYMKIMESTLPTKTLSSSLHLATLH